MTRKYVGLQFGFGAKTHLGFVVEVDNSSTTFAVCGSRKAGTSKRVLGEANLAAYRTAPDACGKCIKLTEEEVGA